jgi:hypothetical protein
LAPIANLQLPVHFSAAGRPFGRALRSSAAGEAGARRHPDLLPIFEKLSPKNLEY